MLYAYEMSLLKSSNCKEKSSSGRSGASGGRVARRRLRMREALLQAGARQFSARGIDTVSVEDLLEEADVSRATFYDIFPNKNNLLKDIINPVFKKATQSVQELERLPAELALNSLFKVYLDLWLEHKDGLMLIPLVDASAFEYFQDQHDVLNQALMSVLMKAEKNNLLRNGSANYSLRILARTAIPLLKVYDGHPSRDELFLDGMKALLVRLG
jgi:AcrR family transcriptional regulator|tara:strand:- start:568 stop:1209 length:642 start_codon:yes stop_codon:yes gene_type:complete